MAQILIKASSILFMVSLGYFFKKRRLLSKENFSILSVIVMNITLPCVIITSLNGLAVDIRWFMVTLFCILANVVLVLVGFLAGKTKTNKAFMMMNISGYNIGNFALPFVSSFFSGFGVLITCMFDAGNSVMCLGTTYGLANEVTNEHSKFRILPILKRLSRSIPTWTYVIMFAIALLKWELPTAVVDLTASIGQANLFLAMFMIGLALDLRVSPENRKMLWFTLVSRYVISAALSVLVYLLPMLPEIKAVLIIILFSPVSSLTPIFTKELEGNVELSACVNSFSMILSMIFMTLLVFLLL